MIQLAVKLGVFGLETLGFGVVGLGSRLAAPLVLEFITVLRADPVVDDPSAIADGDDTDHEFRASPIHYAFSRGETLSATPEPVSSTERVSRSASIWVATS